jgi:tetratricopeptide (TPR) repeat protein
MFENACELEIAGQMAEAMKLFGAAIRVDPQPRYLRRAASAGIKAGELNSAEHYAKKGAELRPRDASYARVLADVYRAQQRFGDAEAVLGTALDLNLENDTLARELRADLDAVRRAQNRSQ